MSTKFGIHRNNIDIQLVEGESVSNEDDDFIEVAFRSNFWLWLDPLAKFLPDNIKVYPLDNSAQGIYTIGDIKRDMQNG